MSPERGGQETGEQLHSILAAELSRRWRWVERERERETRTRYCTTKSGLGTTVWELVAGICRGSGLSGTKGVGWMREGGGREGRGTYYHDVSIVPEDRKLIGRFVILYRRWLVSWLDYLQPRFPVYIWRTNFDPTTRRRRRRRRLDHHYSSFLSFSLELLLQFVDSLRIRLALSWSFLLFTRIRSLFVD